MGMGQRVSTGLGHVGINCALQTQFSSFFFGGEQGNIAIYFT